MIHNIMIHGRYQAVSWHSFHTVTFHRDDTIYYLIGQKTMHIIVSGDFVKSNQIKLN